MNPKIIIFWSVILFIVERLTKYLAFFLPEEGIFYFWQSGFKLYYNPQLAFSIPLNHYLVFALISLIMITLIHYWWKFFIEQRPTWLWPITLIIIGGLSNLLDRWKFGAVIDFIDLGFWPAFNLADVYILTGIIWLIILLNKQGLPKTE